MQNSSKGYVTPVELNSLICKKKELKSEGYMEGVQFTARNYSAVVLLCLKDKFDFSNEQLKKINNHINETFDNVCAGYLSLEDILDTLADEAGILLTLSETLYFKHANKR